MLHDARALEIITQRNALLSTLNMVYPKSLSGRELYEVLLGSFPMLDKSCFLKDLYYLDQKDYIEECTSIRTDQQDDRRWRLTADGNEFANRLIGDNALEP